MTSEERFERIEKNLEAADQRMTRLEKIIEARTEQQQRMIDELLIDRSDHERILKRLVVNHEQHEMRIAKHEEYLTRIERACDFIASSLASLIKSAEDHQRDGHGGQAGKEE